MNKTELIAAIAERTELSKKDAEAAVKAFTETVENTVATGESVQLVGFGTFSMTQKAERMARNPQTGKPVKVEAHSTPKFKAGADFKTFCNK